MAKVEGEMRDQYVIAHYCAWVKIECSKGSACPWHVPFMKPELIRPDGKYKGPCKGTFKYGYCKCSVEHYNRLDKKTIPCPYEHWVQTEEPVVVDGVPTGRMNLIWCMVKEEGLKTPMPSCKATVAGVLDGNRSEARNKGKEREGEDLMLAGKQQVAIGRDATHETYERKDMSAMDKLNFVDKIQGVMEKGQELAEEGRMMLGNASRRRQGTKWDK